MTLRDRVESAINPTTKAQRQGQQALTQRRQQAAAISGRRALSRREQDLFVSNDLQKAFKSLSYSDYVQDFINNTGQYDGSHYTMQQVESAYRTSVYLFAALRRVANLFSEVRIVAEQRQEDGTWKRLPETHHLNMIFSDGGAKLMREAYLYYAMYGKVLVYKRKTRKAMFAYRQGQLITDYMDGGIAGIHIVPNTKWEPYENEYQSEIVGFNLNEPDPVLIKPGMRDPAEFVYIHDFDFRNINDAVSMVSLALNNAVTNGAIARWAAQYFMSGAMPLLLVNIDEDSPTMATEADMLRYKGALERVWQGLWSRFSLRAFFTDRKLNVQQAGIKAQDVMAPELNSDALNAITSVFQIAPDLIVPPPGGTQERHKWLIMDAYNSAVLPVAWQMSDEFNLQFGFGEGQNAPFRLVVAEEDIRALEAERADNLQTEQALFDAGGQTHGEFQERMKVRERIPELSKWVQINGKFQSVARLLRDDLSPAEHIVQYGAQSWVDNILTLGETRKTLFNLDTPPELQNLFYWQAVPQPGTNVPPYQLPPHDTPPTAPAAGGGGSAGGGGASQLPPGGSKTPQVPTPHTAAPKPKPSHDAAPHGSPGAIVPPPAPSLVQQLNKRTPVTPGNDAPAAPDKKDLALPPDSEPNAALMMPIPQGDGDVIADPPDEVALLRTPSEGALEGTPLAIMPPDTPPEADAPASPFDHAPQSIYTCLWLADDPLIVQVQKMLQGAMGDDAQNVEWNAPDTFHITDVYGGECSDEQAQNIVKLTPGQCPALQLRATNLIVFDTPDGQVIALAIEPDEALLALHAATLAAVSSQGISISPFSQPDNYKPHITLGTAKGEIDIPSFTCNLIVQPQSYNITAGEYEPIAVKPSVANWRNEVDDPYIEGQRYDPVTREGREGLYDDLLRRRALMRSALQAWQTTGQPGPGLRDQVRGAVREALASSADDPGRAWLAINLACERGQLDDQSDLEENPIAIPSRPTPPDPQQELKAWERYTLAGKSARPFKANVIPAEIAQSIQNGLAVSTSKKAKSQVFAAARHALAAAGPTDTTEADLTGLAERLSKNDQLSGLLKT